MNESSTTLDPVREYLGSKEEIKKFLKNDGDQNLKGFIVALNELEKNFDMDELSTTSKLNPESAKVLAKLYPQYDKSGNGVLEIGEVKSMLERVKSSIVNRDISKKSGLIDKVSEPNDSNAYTRYKEFLFREEGGLRPVNVKNDRGGLTNAGITIGTWKVMAPKVLGIKGTPETLKNLTKKQWNRFVDYWWDKNKGNDIRNKAVAAAIIDTMWGSGPGTALIKVVQPVLKNDFGKDITVDGVMGGRTIRAINSIKNQSLLLRKLIERRQKFINDIATGSQASFKDGWTNRINRFKSEFA